MVITPEQCVFYTNSTKRKDRLLQYSKKAIQFRFWGTSRNSLHDGAAAPFFCWLCSHLLEPVWLRRVVRELRRIKPVLVYVNSRTTLQCQKQNLAITLILMINSNLNIHLSCALYILIYRLDKLQSPSWIILQLQTLQQISFHMNWCGIIILSTHHLFSLVSFTFVFSIH